MRVAGEAAAAEDTVVAMAVGPTEGMALGLGLEGTAIKMGMEWEGMVVLGTALTRR